MALARRKFWRTRGGAFLALAVLAFAGAAGSLRASVSERVVSDLHTGLAIYGFDPVAYFTDAKALIGQPEFELQMPDSIWRFRSRGNLAAFAAHPEIYRPRYGGYDPIALARGVAVAGNPLIWTVTGDRLYLFYSAKARETFRLDPESAIAAAEERWPQVLQTLPQ